MGRLKIRKLSLRRLLLNWGLPAVLVLGILFGFHTLVRAATPPSASELSTYLASNSLYVNTETVNGYQQVYYLYPNPRQIFLTSANYSHIHPVASDHYVAWQGLTGGGSQIYIYDVLTNALTQLTSSGTNQNPAIYKNTVAWESWVDDQWQVFYYDGYFVRQLTSGSTSSIRPIVNGSSVIYAQQLNAGTWRAYAYDISTQTTSQLREGDEASTAYPKFGANGTVTTDVKTFYNL